MFTDDPDTALSLGIGFDAFMTFFSFMLYITTATITLSFLFFTLKESYSAEHLISRIKNTGHSK
jgi:hypothetical protein